MNASEAAAAERSGETRAETLTVWCLLRDQRGHVQPVEDALADRARFVYDAQWDPDALRAARPDAVVCVNDFAWETAQCLDAAREAGIPSLVLQDGILEWRCQYENPLFGAGGGAPQHQPVLADKIACLGRSSARHIASWGNDGKVEVTGMPKLDGLLARRPAPPARPGRRLLVATAKKPWYDEAQRRVIEQSLVDLREHLATRPEIEVVWRVTRGLSEALGVSNRLKELETAELSRVLAEVDAVITTPSTVMLEAMLAQRPVAALDYHNRPRFVATAWTASASSHLPELVRELLDPPASRMLFQAECLRDSLRVDGPAAARVARLISDMARLGRQARAAGAPLRLPPGMAGDAAAPTGGAAPALADLYPGQGAFSRADPGELQARLARLEAENRRLRSGSLRARLERVLRGDKKR